MIQHVYSVLTALRIRNIRTTGNYWKIKGKILPCLIFVLKFVINRNIIRNTYRFIEKYLLFAETCVLYIEFYFGFYKIGLTLRELKHINFLMFRYKMSMSCGGGYCDCGDAEAWSQNVHCAIHILGTSSSSTTDGAASDALSRIPDDIKNRAGHVFESVLRFTYELLTADSFLNLPPDLTLKEKGDDFYSMMDNDEEDSFCTVVYNDEVHTFDEVRKH